MTAHNSNPIPAGSPFSLEGHDAYASWRERKLSQIPLSLNEITVQIKDPLQLSNTERSQLLANCENVNMSLYRLDEPAMMDKTVLAAMCAQIGLQRLDSNLCADEDGISSIQVEPKGSKQEYIPYSEMPINWHTDGYYNRPEQQIRGMVLHCARASQSGGGNGFIDPELVYIALRDHNPNYIYALSQNDAMIIPANVQNGHEIRPEQGGPVFSLDPLSGKLHMRYTARTRSIHWQNQADTMAAVKFLEGLLCSDQPYIYRHTLSPGEGIVSNNVLHCRERFVDGADPDRQRLVYRARFYERVGKK